MTVSDNESTQLSVLHYHGNIGIIVWNEEKQTEGLRLKLNPGQALMIAAALQKAAMAEINL